MLRVDLHPNKPGLLRSRALARHLLALVDPGNAEAIAQIMTALESMGLPEMLLQQVRSSIPPAPAGKAKVVSNEKRLAQLGSKINILEQQSAKLTKHIAEA